MLDPSRSSEDGRKPGITVVIAMVVAVGVAAAVLTFSTGSATGNAPNSRPAALLGLAIGVVVMAALVIGVAVRRLRRQRPVPPSAADAAAGLGLGYTPDGDKGLAEAYSDLPGIRRSARTRHVMEGGIRGMAVTAFETMYVVYTGQVNVPVLHTVYAVETPIWPGTTITPRSGVGRFLHRLGVRRGLLLEDPQFNRVFKVRSSDEDFALTILGPDVQQFMLGKRNVRWHLGHGRLCLIYSGALRPGRIAASLDRLLELRERIPPEVDAWEVQDPARGTSSASFGPS